MSDQVNILGGENLMNWYSFCAAVLLLTLSVDARAQDSTRVALDLGVLIGSETACELIFDQEAIASFIEAKVPESDMEFMSTMNASTRLTEREMSNFTPSQKTAHCTQVRRAAKAYSFVD